MSIQNPTASDRTSATIEIGPFTFESGEQLQQVELAYERVGPVDAPLILVCHALTGNQDAVGLPESPGWWSGLIGPGAPIDTEKYQVITFNVLGGCHGSTGPASLHPETQEPYRLSFPTVTIRDIVHAQYLALQKLDIKHIHSVVGGSLGGMQVCEWGLLYPKFMHALFILAATPYLSDYGIAFNHIGARAIQDDPFYKEGQYNSNEDLRGFELARMAGMVTYRSNKLFEKRFDRGLQPSSQYKIQSYLNYQGEKIKQRFDANSYLYLLNAMNHHDIGRNRGNWKKAAQQYQVPVYSMSFEHDLLYPEDLMQQFSTNVPQGEHRHVSTDYGHDGFLVEFDRWGEWIREKLASLG
ncbi:homoserine O-acetyltransferase MetX [Halobacillus salinus]|uniref:homoserine O-acetyltransferase MetX n=1 Tax=Halobacillus salinus TaxID=192814 RepID=UPI0009A8C97F|nr:homoserine O-acetyltransferase [Halobacillus salinus]